MDEELGSVVTIEELSDYLKISRSTPYKLAQEGRVPCQQVGRHCRLRKEAVDQWLEEGLLADMRAEGGNS